ncbi:hypothetical protein [Streptomyces sp. NBC_00154]|uniref:hypothetical protein n=1 Tax=Streptomyces sp. NBC_00154 TaxID=2975670 RepID=UPI0022526039|nr:hypothetical protein [Streptomyces sp. NBC_00154]MCX5315449.1 hypothetical protein [Streptomyces sp. NBC_00154]
MARTTALLSSDGTTYPDLGDRDTHNTGFDRLGQGRPLGLPGAVWITIVPAALVTVLLR